MCTELCILAYDDVVHIDLIKHPTSSQSMAKQVWYRIAIASGIAVSIGTNEGSNLIYRTEGNKRKSIELVAIS